MRGFYFTAVMAMRVFWRRVILAAAAFRWPRSLAVWENGNKIYLTCQGDMDYHYKIQDKKWRILANMQTYELIAPCHFGLEAVLKREIYDLGYEITRVEDGRVTFTGDAEAICRANLFLRTAERVLLLLKTFPAATFDELFDGVYSIPWEELIPVDAQFPVKGSSLSSQLSSVPACQSIVKKAIVKRLQYGHKTTTLPETGALYKIRFALRKNVVEVMLDTSGDGLHKRGYRKNATLAPIKETLAATIGEEAVTLEDVYEPYLMQIGFLSRTPRGRCVTRLAYDHLNIPFTPAYQNKSRNPVQMNFFTDNDQDDQTT